MQRRFLIAPLDWGLGHASRCIPIIRALLDHGHQVILGGSGSSIQLLQKEFPALPVRALPSYDPQYPRGKGMVAKMISQLPRFIRVIKEEQKRADEIVRLEVIDVIISDNRYGCRSEKAKSILMTHQSNILMPKRFGWLSPAVRKVNRTLMNRFDMIWIPDYPEEFSLAGELISFGNERFNKPVRYLGSLSRFATGPEVEKTYDVVAVCSGPEPQRSVLEKKLVEQLRASRLKYALIRGIIKDANPVEVGNGTIINYLTTDRMRDVLMSANIVISRSGYSTVMDLSALGLKAIFIPTPGQTEQEYLAARLKERKIAFSMEQEHFNLDAATKASIGYTGFRRSGQNTLLNSVIEEVANGNLISESIAKTNLKA